MKKVLAVIGARPQFVKAAAITRAHHASAAKKRFRFVWVHTGQHYDVRLSRVFFREFSLPKPRYNLRVGSLPHTKQIGRMFEGLERVMMKENPDLVLVFGDTNSTLAGALAAAKLQVPVAHIEAGLRSFNRAMPEETNRVVTDVLSSLWFCPTAFARKQLLREGIRKNVHLVGDVMADVLAANVKKMKRARRAPYYLATIHRNTNTDIPSRLAAIFRGLAAMDREVLMPLHPRTRNAMRRNAAAQKIVRSAANLKLLQPQPYLKMLSLEKYADGVITDSGGVQKEAFWLGIPCVTLRRETEWSETLASGMNTLCEPSAKAIRSAFRRMEKTVRRKSLPVSGASARIIRVLDRFLAKRKNV